jgi:hypothetical protein
MRIAAERRRSERAQSLRAAGVDQLILATDEDYAPPLHRAFARRARGR